MLPANSAPAIPSPWPNRLRLAAAGVISGIPAALVGGLLSRVAMRITAVLENEPTGFSVIGTLAIAVVWVIMFGFAGGILTPLIVRGTARSRLVQTLASGFVAFVLFGIPFLLSGTNGLGTAQPRWLNLTMYGLIFFLQGLGNVWVYAWYEKRLKLPQPGRRGRLIWYCFLSLLAPLGAALFIVGVLVPSL
ncbi:MAG: hypothetical protein K0R39_2121 [Symbiobacteriaceae bacterium]|jgi:hypothetical protein|nr:hypothetical protein [Symbiobacteriaceae bacterium]